MLKCFFLCYNMYIVSGTTAFPVISTFATPVPGTIRSHFSNFFQQILGSEKRHCFHSFWTSSSNWELHTHTVYIRNVWPIVKILNFPPIQPYHDDKPCCTTISVLSKIPHQDSSVSQLTAAKKTVYSTCHTILNILVSALCFRSLIPPCY